MKPASSLTISEIQQALHKGELSAQAIAQQTLDAITVANPLINAYTHITADRMLSEACRLDTLRAKASRCQHWRQSLMRSRICSMLPEKQPYQVPAYFVIKPRQTGCLGHFMPEPPGAMLSGMLNMDAYAYGFTTENSHYGATHNPHDLNRIAGDLLADLRQRSPQGSCTFSRQ